MNQLAQMLADRIEASGPMTFAEYMRSALYDPTHGYYRSGSERTGWRGDYLTSPEIDPAFGILWTQGFAEIWEQCGRPDEFHLVEVGPGEGGLASAVVSSVSGDFSHALTLELVEIDPERRARQRSRLGTEPTWHDAIEKVQPFAHGCVFLNEVLDNQPVELLRKQDGTVTQLHVIKSSDGLAPEWLPCDDPGLIRRANANGPPGTVLEVSPDAEDLVRRCTRLVGRGGLVIVDYGRRSSATTLVSYSKAGTDDRWLEDPGTKDITAHVDWSAISSICEREGLETAGPRRQREVLQSLGARDLDDGLRKEHDAAIESGSGAIAVRVLSRRQALRALVDPGGLGGLDMLAALKEIDAPDFLKQELKREPGRETAS